MLLKDTVTIKSLPARGAWIEILHNRNDLRKKRVAPREGSVD